MEFKYYRELKHNYLCAKKEDTESPDGKYRYRIAESGRIKSLIPMSERSINSETYIYYETGSMQSIRDRFAVRGMSFGDVTSLLADMKALVLELSEFLLGEEGVVFDTGCIYTDLRTNRFRFMYCPFYDEKKSFPEFAMDLLSLVDEKDEKATDLVYRLCEESEERGGFFLDMLETGESLGEDENVMPAETPSEKETSFDGELFDEEEDEAPEPDTPRIKRAGKRLGGKAELFFSLMFGLLLCAMVYIRMNFILSAEENLLSIMVMVVSALTGVIALIAGFKDLKSSAPVKKPKPEKAAEADEDDDFYEMEDFSEMADTARFAPPREDSGKGSASERTTGPLPEAGHSYGETMVLDEIRRDHLTLFSRNLDKTARIELDALPLTVGKMEGYVNRTLSDSSVSRIHCRFEKKGERVIVRDLGSTNGTFKNGIRLNPQEEAIVDEGDEIRIGRVCFDCR